jgi:hypothetical protein
MEFNLSKKGRECLCGCKRIMFYDEDVKEFIRLLKEACVNCPPYNLPEFIDKLAGEKLI